MGKIKTYLRSQLEEVKIIHGSNGNIMVFLVVTIIIMKDELEW